jgi:hypothetical protein
MSVNNWVVEILKQSNHMQILLYFNAGKSLHLKLQDNLSILLTMFYCLVNIWRYTCKQSFDLGEMELNLVIVSGFVSTMMIFLSTHDLLSGLSVCETILHFTIVRKLKILICSSLLLVYMGYAIEAHIVRSNEF